MPLLGTNDMDTHALGGNGFSFSGTRIGNLGATEYTLVTILVDTTGSTSGYEGIIRDMIQKAVEACQKSPRSDNLLVRLLFFSSSYPQGTNELHGFKPLSEIDPAAYPTFSGSGGTPLYDATYDGVGAMNAYAQMLYDQEFMVNGITFIITDGGDNQSRMGMQAVKEEVQKSVTGEVMESHVTVLIGIDTNGSAAGDLARFQQEAGLTQFIDAGKVTKGSLAKLAAFVSHSVSSTAQALGTGGPSQAIPVVI